MCNFFCFHLIEFNIQTESIDLIDQQNGFFLNRKTIEYFDKQEKNKIVLIFMLNHTL